MNKDTSNLSRILNTSLIFTCGVSGSGKTFFASHLMNRGFHKLSSDEMAWNLHGDSLASLPFPEQRKVFQEISALMDGQMLQILKAGGKVIVDSTMCKRARRDYVKNFVRELGITPLIIFFDTPQETIRRRMEKRKGIGPNDQIVPPERLEMFFENFEVPDDDENVLRASELSAYWTALEEDEK